MAETIRVAAVDGPLLLGGVKVYGVQVSPDLAKLMLTRNTLNRPVRTVLVNKYIKDIHRGKWKLHHQGVAFDTSGTLLDGQHRLLAIAKGEESVLMLVSMDVDPEARMAVDDHSKRTARDAVELIQNGVTAVHTSVASLMLQVGPTLGYNAHAVSKFDINEVMSRHRPKIDFAVKCMNAAKSARITGLSSAALGAVITKAAYHHQEAKIEEFVYVLQTGEMSAPHHVCAVTLRNWVMQNGGKKSGGSYTSEYYKRIEYTLKEFLAERQTRQCRAVSREQFEVDVLEKDEDWEEGPDGENGFSRPKHTYGSGR